LAKIFAKLLFFPKYDKQKCEDCQNGRPVSPPLTLPEDTLFFRERFLLENNFADNKIIFNFAI
jgi:hypothetical protein